MERRNDTWRASPPGSCLPSQSTTMGNPAQRSIDSIAKHSHVTLDRKPSRSLRSHPPLSRSKPSKQNSPRTTATGRVNRTPRSRVAFLAQRELERQIFGGILNGCRSHNLVSNIHPCFPPLRHQFSPYQTPRFHDRKSQNTTRGNRGSTALRPPLNDDSRSPPMPEAETPPQTPTHLSTRFP